VNCDEGTTNIGKSGVAVEDDKERGKVGYSVINDV